MRSILPSLVLAAGGAMCVPPASTFAAPAPQPTAQNLVRYVDPMCGTGGFGNTFPGATVPFGMVQWSPDTGNGTKKGGYSLADSTIAGFSLDHLSGAGCVYAENFSFMPVVGAPAQSPGKNRAAFSSPFIHQNEVIHPGYYGVTLGSGIKVELTTTVRSGFGRFTYPAGGPATMTINAGSAVWGAAAADIRIDPAQRSVSGSATYGHFCQCGAYGRVFFYAVFDRPFSALSTWSGDTLVAGRTSVINPIAGAVVSFDLDRTRTVLAKVGFSYVSVANAKANLEAENPVAAFTSAGFDRAAQAASDTWNARLNRIQLTGGTPDQRRTFYSMFYHALLGPTVCSDANGEYLGYDGQVHRVAPGRTEYSNFSGWDVYRSECQFLAMVAPRVAGDFAQSLLVEYQQGGAFPKWGVPFGDTGVMVGDPAAPAIADFYAFGARRFDARAALDALLRAATDPTVRAPRTGLAERDGLADYLRLGYVPEEAHGGSVGITLEYASADFALSRFAHALGNDSAARLCLQHSQAWRNLFNPQTGYLQMRRADGSWAPGWTDNAEYYDKHRAYVEGTAAHYVWMVPFDLKGLAEKMGGPAVAARRLDAFFSHLNGGDHSRTADLGNEPTLETPWIYDFLGQPWKTQETVRRAMRTLFSSDNTAYPGNDDLGEMSSWYIFGALGMYPELPGSDVLVLAAPLFPQAVVHLNGGDLVIRGQGAAADAPYVQSLTVNGEPWQRPWLRFRNLARGATLDFRLAAKPNHRWGSAPADAPPSYGD